MNLRDQWLDVRFSSKLLHCNVKQCFLLYNASVCNLYRFANRQSIYLHEKVRFWKMSVILIFEPLTLKMYHVNLVISSHDKFQENAFMHSGDE